MRLTSSQVGMNNRRLRRVVSPMSRLEQRGCHLRGGVLEPVQVDPRLPCEQQSSAARTMRTPTPSLPVLAIALCLAVGGLDAARPAQPARSSDLDAFMEKVLARRDENWSKLQQYVLDERERAQVVGPAGARLYGLDREYTWYIRDGAFVRSPVRFDGVTLSEAERQAYERQWIERERQREARRSARGSSAAPETSADEPPTDVDGLLKLTREPQFVSA